MIQPLHHFHIWFLIIVRFSVLFFFPLVLWKRPGNLAGLLPMCISRDTLTRKMTGKAVVVMHTQIRPILLHLNHHSTCRRCQLQQMRQVCMNKTQHFPALRCDRCCSRARATSANPRRALSEANNINREYKAAQYHLVFATHGTQCASPHGKREINLLQRGGWHCARSKVTLAHWLHCV